MTAGPAARLTAALADRYRLERELGQGGMATVYLAQDLKHDRRVAIKVLHPELSAVIGGERFLSEIKVTANLQHPHILPLFDSGAADGLLFYVMPYVQGESLRAKMSREKQLGVEEAVRLASQVASALDYAHRQGVVHRDIKPENVLLHDGTALVADFGIALAATNAGASRMTATGMSLGTPAYMSPEQAMGDREVDARSDVYSLATMLYEMLVGDPPHSGSTAQAIVAKVLTEKPVPVTVHRDTVPSNVAAAVQKALAKLPADRFASAADFAKALATPGWSSGELLATTAMPAAAVRGQGRNAWPFIALGGALVAGLAGFLLRPEPPRQLRRYEVLTRGIYSAISMSPDGATLVAAGVGLDSSGGNRLWVLRPGQLDPTRIEGIQGVQAIFSPDGKEIAVFTDTKKVIRTNLDGSAQQVIADSAEFGGDWGDDGYLYYTHIGFSLARRPIAGGPVEMLTTLAKNANEFHSQPQLLPGGRSVLFTAVRTLTNDATHEIRVVDLATRKEKVIARGFSAVYGDGQLVFVTAGGALLRAPFDPERLEMTGPAVTVATGAASVAGYSMVSLSDNGTLLYQLGSTTTAFQRLLTVTRAGTAAPLPLPGDAYNSLRLSPDGTRLAYEVSDGVNDGGNVFVLTLGDSVPVRLTFQGVHTYPTWSLDGKRVAFSRLLDGERDLAWQAADGSGGATTLLARPGDQFEVEFVPGDRIVVREGNASGGAESLDLRTFAIGSDSATDFAVSAALERSMRVSPDGRWIAFVSDQGGRNEVYVRPFPDPGTGAVWQVTNDGGEEPVWARSGRELFFKSRGVMYSADIRTTPSFAVGARRRLFPTTGLFDNPWHARYDVLPGDTAFVMIGGLATTQRIRTVVVENWLAEAERAR
jgi:serine/threonine-protein kinase